MTNMTRYKLECPVDSHIPDFTKGKEIEIARLTKLYHSSEKGWRVSIEIEADSQQSAINAGFDKIKRYILWFQLRVPLEPPTANIRAFVSREKGYTLKNLDGRGSLITSNTATVTYPPKVTVGEYPQKMMEDFFRNAPRSLMNGREDLETSKFWYERSEMEGRREDILIDLMVFLESILSDNQELAEKISRRTAVIVSTDFDNEQETFDLMKELYNIRSKIIHGTDVSSIKTEKEKIVKLSSIARVVFRNYLILLDKYGKKEEVKKALDRFFDPETKGEIKKIINDSLKTDRKDL